MSTHKNYPLAAALALASFTGWTFSDALLKLVREENIPQGQIMLVSGLSGMAVIFLLSAFRGHVKRLQPHRWRGLIGLGLCQSLAFVFWICALPHLPLAHMYTVAFLTPMTVAGMAALVLKEHLGWKRACAIGAGFAGVVISVNPVGLMQNSAAWFPYLAVFGSMTGTATQMLLLRGVGRTESSEAMSFYPRMALVIVGACYCAVTGFAAMKPMVFLAICGSGALGALGWAMLSKAYKNAPAAAVAPFHYSQMISGSILGYLIWDNKPDLYLLIGAAIIVASGVYLVRHEKRISRMMINAEEVSSRTL